MKKILALMLVMQSLAVAANVQISEVYYDPVNTESGGEAVELYNPGSAPVDISGWIIRTEASVADATIPSGKIIQPESYFLIADAGFSSSKDNPSWPDADYEEAITLANTDSGIALIENGTAIDAVGWGSAAGIDAGLFEGSPHPGASSGQSLQRTQDTQDNSQDFIPAAPNLQSASYIEGNTIQLLVSVTQASPSIDSFDIIPDDDATKSGIQITPQPKGKKLIPLSAVVSSGQVADITSVRAILGAETVNLTKAMDINTTSAKFEGSVGIDFFEDPGNYTITITAASESSSSRTAAFEYLSLIGLEIDASSLICSSSSGQSCSIPGDQNISTTDKVTVRNIGNVVIDSEISGTDLNSGSASIPVANVKYSFSPSLAAPQTLTTSPIRSSIGLVHGSISTKELSFGVTIPSSTPAGDYVGTISLVAVQS
ncbi:lamin tail domain-containing protein [Candidatus Woesearchaeota archaeon]|nr:lamin tail domain-containing protein [Candidatus Woesearchaeota archaeon]